MLCMYAIIFEKILSLQLFFPTLLFTSLHKILMSLLKITYGIQSDNLQVTKDNMQVINGIR